MMNEARRARRQLPRLSNKGLFFYPSSASVEVLENGERIVKGACLRKQFWYHTGRPSTSPTPDSISWRAELGDAVSEKLEEILKYAGTFVAAEYPFVDMKNRVSGRIDLIYKHPITKQFVGVEVKSIGGYHQLKGITAGYPLAPKEGHLLQTTCYIDYFYEHEVFPIPTFELAYLARCTGDQKSFAITLSPGKEVLVDNIPQGFTPAMVHERFSRLGKYIESNTLPPRDFDLQFTMQQLEDKAAKGKLAKVQTSDVKKGKFIQKGDACCGWCPYRDDCWKPEDIPKKQGKGRRKKQKGNQGDIPF